MANAQYYAISQPNTTFNQPRQRTWAVIRKNDYGWQLDLESSSFSLVQRRAKQILDAGGEYTSINKVMVVEIIPIDTVITPTV
jgi:asparagine N-glycosylation enzyme membrane subunit Stt3